MLSFYSRVSLFFLVVGYATLWGQPMSSYFIFLIFHDLFWEHLQWEVSIELRPTSAFSKFLVTKTASRIDCLSCNFSFSCDWARSLIKLCLWLALIHSPNLYMVRVRSMCVLFLLVRFVFTAGKIWSIDLFGFVVFFYRSNTYATCNLKAFLLFSDILEPWKTFDIDGLIRFISVKNINLSYDEIYLKVFLR